MPQTEQGEGVHRLTNMLVEEVSLVDRAANKRTFLVVKRASEPGEKTMLKSDGRGGFTNVSKSEATEEKAAPPPPEKKPEDDEAEKAATKKAGDDAAEALEDIAEELLEIAESLEGADEVSEETATRMTAAHKKMGDTVSKHATKKSIEVEKVGRKMSRQRLDTFKKALDMLGGILKELDQVAETLEASEKSKAEKREEVTKALRAEIAAKDREISRLKGGASSNSIPVDKSAGASREEEDVSWPMDMNRPIERSRTEKDVSFYD